LASWVAHRWAKLTHTHYDVLACSADTKKSNTKRINKTQAKVDD